MNPIVFIVDDDDSVREALSNLSESAGLRASAFASARDFLASEKPDAAACLILDLELPDINGLELQQLLANQDAPPIVFITGHGDIPATVRAMKAGALEFLTKPFPEQEILKAIEAGIALDQTKREQRAEIAELRSRHALLTPREKEILPYVVAGFANKQTADEMGTSGFTVAVQRGQIMRKMGAQSLAELVRMADRLGIPRVCAHK